MEQLARKLADANDSTAGTLADAIELSRHLAIGSAMQQTATDLGENRIGQALEREFKIADYLQQVLNLLRNERESRPEQLVEKLKQAEQRLAQLRQQLVGLRQETAQAEQKPNNVNQGQLRRLNDLQQDLRRDIEQLARQLERLQAEDASKSAQNAGGRLGSRQAVEKRPDANAQRPRSSSQVQRAEQDLEQAARQLSERRQQAENDLALEFVRRFQAELSQMVQRQQRVVKQTVEIDAARQASTALSPEQTQAVAELADQERQLAGLAKEHSELLVGLGAVRVSLEDAERRLTAAGKLLAERQTGQAAQAAEQLALVRLEAMMQAFAQTANEAAQKPNANAAPPAAANNQLPPQHRPTFELLQVKMLRMLQSDLNERTRQHEKRFIRAAENPAIKAALDQESLELAAEQGRLAELVRKMLAHDNEMQKP